MMRKLQSDTPARAIKNPARETEHTTQGTTPRQKEKVHEPRQKDYDDDDDDDCFEATNRRELQLRQLETHTHHRKIYLFLLVTQGHAVLRNAKLDEGSHDKMVTWTDGGCEHGWYYQSTLPIELPQDVMELCVFS